MNNREYPIHTTSAYKRAVIVMPTTDHSGHSECDLLITIPTKDAGVVK
jgi:hypothetical protein